MDTSDRRVGRPCAAAAEGAADGQMVLPTSNFDSQEVDPFTSRLELTRWDWFKSLLGSILILPFRAVAVVLVLLSAWFWAKIGLIGYSSPNAAPPPLVGWRRALLEKYSYFGLFVFWAAGFVVRVKGEQAPPEEAPILVGAPHSSFLEAMLVVMCRCSPVSRIENKNAIVIAVIQRFLHTIFVDRRSPESRKKAADDITERAHSLYKPRDGMKRRASSSSNNNLQPDSDPASLQVFIFPEGTNTNRKSLVQFKRGAFNPGTPVQPVLVRYPGYDDLDAITWTFRQSHSYLFSVWLLLTRPINRLEVEFLPVYKPGKEEREDPDLFARNVQILMAKELEIFPSLITYYKNYEEYCRQVRDKKSD